LQKNREIQSYHPDFSYGKEKTQAQPHRKKIDFTTLLHERHREVQDRNFLDGAR